MLIAGRYKQVRVLGQGGMGTVYLVEDTLESDHQLALKTQILSGESVRLVGALKHEFRTLSRLSHPHIARVYDFGTLRDEDGTERFFFTSEYVDGTDLRDAPTPGGWDDWYEYAAQLFRALSYIHSHGIIHRDIKPANILVSKTGELKLVDFGVVSHTRFIFAGHTLVGTPAYTAPEVIRGDPPGPGSDLYAAGVSLYQVATGQLPYVTDKVKEMLTAHLSARPPSPRDVEPSVPEPFAAFLLRLLAKEPSARFATAGRALAALSNVAGRTFELETPETRVGYIHSGEFVGRNQELDRLKRRASNLSATAAPAAMIVRGPFGVGKSRLLRELRISQQLAGRPVYSTEVGASADALAPWRSLVRQVAAGTHDDDLLAEYRDELAALDVDPETSRADLRVAAVGSFLAEAARREPYILQIDEIGRADPATLEIIESFLELLARTSQRPPLLVVVTVETDTSAGARAAESWIERELAEDMTLELLPLSATGMLAASMLGAERLPERSTRRLHEASQGNPFILGEILKELASSGQIERRPSGDVHVADFQRPSVSKQLDDVLRDRIASCSDGARHVLDALGALNRPADADALAALGIEDTEATGEALGELMRARLVMRRADGRFVLTPPVLAEVLRAALSDDDRARLHAAAGAYLEASSEEVTAAELADHYGRAGDTEREAQFARAAGESLKRLHVYEEALRWFSRAAELATERDLALELSRAQIEQILGHPDLRERVEWLRSRVDDAGTHDITIRAEIFLLAAQVAQAAGDAEQARADSDAARRIAEGAPLDVVARVAAACAKLLLEQGQTEEAVALVDETLGTLDRDTREAADLMLVLGDAELARGHLDEAKQHVDEALKKFRESSDRRGEVLSMHMLGRIHYRRGESDAARNCFREAAEGFLGIGEWSGRVNVQMNLGVLLHASSDYVGAIEAYHDALQLLQKGGSAREQALVGCNLGNLYCLLGNLELARDTTVRSLELAREADFKQVEGYDEVVLGAVARSQDAPQEALQRFADAVEILEGAGQKPLACIAAAKQADVYRDLQQWDAALDLLREAEAVGRDLGAPAALARALTSRGRLEVARGEDLDRAATYLQEASALAEKEGDAELQGEIDHGVALIMERRGDADEAIRILRELEQRREATRASLPPEYAAHFYDDFERASARATLRALSRTESTPASTPAPPESPSSPFREIPSVVITPEPTRISGSMSGNPVTVDLTPTSAVWTSAAVKRLLEIVSDLNAEHDVEKLLVKILDAAIALTGAERGFVIQLHNGKLDIRTARNLDGVDLPIDRFPVSRTIAEEVARSGEPVLSHDAVHDAQLRAGVSIQALGTQSILAVPLRSKGRSIGAVWLEHRFRVGAFTHREIELSQTLADQAGTALENARLLGLTQRRAKQLEKAQAEVAALNEKLQARVAEQDEELATVKEILSRTQSDFVTRYDYNSIIGRSEALKRVLRVLDRVTDSDINVLIEGESGTGKELVARALHANGPRSKEAFVSENCGAVPETLLESTLFGHVKGAFTGAVSDRKGLFELADGGTLLLDEVGEMPAPMQVKLLRALQEQEVRRIGAPSTIRVDVRVIAATNRDLATEVKEGRFREDLYYRLNVVRVELPPLRDRKEDIPLLVDHFLEQFHSELGKGPTSLSKSAIAHLIRHDWPGNIRELENTLKKAYVLCEGHAIGPSDLEDLATPAPSRAKPVPDDERERMLRALEEADGKVARAAEAIGMPVRTFYYKLSKMGLARRGPRRS